VQRRFKDPASLSDELLINDGGTLKKITLQQISALVTIPFGTVNDYAGTTAPAGWLFCYGQAVSRVTYAALFTAIGVTFGSGDGSSTFNLPDCRGRVAAGKDDMGGISANRLTTPLNGDNLGDAGGGQTHILTELQMPQHTHTDAGHTHNVAASVFAQNTVAGAVTNFIASGATATTLGFAAISYTGGSQAHPNVQPTAVINKIIKYTIRIVRSQQWCFPAGPPVQHGVSACWKMTLAACRADERT
jgi:microcystin-dependent protein